MRGSLNLRAHTTTHTSMFTFDIADESGQRDGRRVRGRVFFDFHHTRTPEYCMMQNCKTTLWCALDFSSADIFGKSDRHVTCLKMQWQCSVYDCCLLTIYIYTYWTDVIGINARPLVYSIFTWKIIVFQIKQQIKHNH